MSQSKKRKHPNHPNHPPVPQVKKTIRKVRIISVAAIIFLIFGVGIAFFAAGNNAVWLIAGGIIGALGGCLFGLQIVKGLLKK